MTCHPGLFARSLMDIEDSPVLVSCDRVAAFLSPITVKVNFVRSAPLTSTPRIISRLCGESNKAFRLNRRQFASIVLQSLALSTGFSISGQRSAEGAFGPFVAPEDLKIRLAKGAPGRPEEKLFQEDIFYPDYFAGVWKTESKLLSVSCPAGYKLFGRTGAFEQARAEINQVLSYDSRFVRDGRRRVISDRPFNVKSIAEASMGTSSVLNIELVNGSPNLMTSTICPNEADGAVFVVNIKALSRHQQNDDISRLGEGFGLAAEAVVRDSEKIGLYCSEMVRQQVRLDTNDLRVMPMTRDVETSTVFVVDEDQRDEFVAFQRTSSYLTRANLQYVDARGRPIDVRCYQLRYSRKNKVN